MKRYRLKVKLRIDDLQTRVDHMTVHNPATELAFKVKSQSRWVIIRGVGNAPDVPGFVVAFLPEHMLRVMDDLGEIRIASIDQVEEDVHRRIYGKTSKRTSTQLHTAHLEGNQGGAPGVLLAPVS